ncbi:MAG TPA: hypothetical protein VNK94_00575 [Gaiellaceae bacterium]|nr:hypothetical protein [Gaiellaceae bacterium]
MADLPGLLFYEGELSAVLEAAARRMDAEIESAPEDHVLHADDDAWVDALVTRHSVVAPRLRVDEVWMDAPEEVKVDVGYDYARRALNRGQSFFVAGARNTVHIPFDGDAGVFRFTPSTRNFNPPRAEVRAGELVRSWEYPHDSPIDLGAEVDALVGSIQSYLSWAASDIANFNATLEPRARRLIVTRRDRIRTSYERAASSGIPIGPRGQREKTYITDAIVRVPSPVTPARAETPIPLEPTLGDEHFEHILHILRAFFAQVERTPETYAKLSEEERRDLIVTTLNTHYRGQTTAEAFNAHGKTDILVRVDDRNVFIGEAKFWSGEKAFTEAVDQLFSYAAWRDTKLALIVFVREKGFSAIVQKAQAALEEHTAFGSWEETATETELRAQMRWPGDDERLADLNVFLVHSLWLEEVVWRDSPSP